MFYFCLLIPLVGVLASLLSIISLAAATLSVEEMNINSTDLNLLIIELNSFSS